MRRLIRVLSLIVFLMCFGSLTLCFAQVDSRNLHVKEGILIHSESSPVSNGDINVSGYRLEKVKLEKPWGAGDPPVDSVFRIVIVLNDSVPLSHPGFSIWLDDNQIGFGAYRLRPNEFAVLLYARTLPDDTLKVSISKRGERDMISRAILPGRLHVPPEYATSAEEVEANRPIIKLRRIRSRHQQVELKVVLPGMSCVSWAIPFVIEVDGEELGGYCTGKSMVVVLTIGDFDRLRDGAEIVIKRGSGRDATGRNVVGRLVKSTIQ